MISKLPLLPKGGVARNLVQLFLMFGIIPLGILALTFFYLYFHEKKLAVAELQLEVAERIATGVSGHLERTKGKIELFAHLYDLMSMDAQTLRNTAYEIIDQELDYNVLTITDSEGRELFKVSRYYTFNRNQLNTLPEAFLLLDEPTKKTRISKIQISPFNKLPEIHVTVPILDSAEKVKGLLDVGVNVARMWDLISKYRLGKDRYAYVVDSQGTLLAYRDISSVLAKSDLENIEVVKKLMNQEVGVFEYKGLEGNRVIGASTVIPLTGWGIIVEEPLAKAYRDLYFLSATFLGIFLITTVSALVLGLRFSFRNLVRPLRNLQEQAAAFAQGDFAHRIDTAPRRDELGQLSESFNKMAADLERTTVSRDLLIKEIEQRKHTEEELQKLASVVRHSKELVNLATLDGKMIFLNDAGREMLGIAPEDVEHTHILQTIPAQMHEMVQTELLPTLLTHGSWRGELQYRNLKTGKLTGVYAETFTITNPGTGAPVLLANVSLDITERRQAEEALRETNEALQALVQASPVAIIVLDTDGRAKLWNPAAQGVFGWSEEEVIGQLLPFVPEDKSEEHRALRERVLRGDAFTEVEVRRRRKDGSPIDLSVSTAPLRDARGNVTGIMSLFIDITDRKRSEEEKLHLQSQLRQAHKMEAVGTLAGGVAHDFNNILAAIIGYTEMALTDISRASPSRHYLEQVLNAGQRAKDLVKQILVFSRMKHHQERTPVEIAPVIKEALKLLRASLPTTIEIRQNIAIKTSAVLADPTEIHQIVVNLCTNAAHAMEETGGILEVCLTEVVVDSQPCGVPQDLNPGRYLRLTVSDTGRGMDSATLDRIFDPYFTTKEVGKGSGLGLAVVQGIVKRHEGAIMVHSEPEVGTRFHVYFPKLTHVAEREADRVETPIPKGTGRILFVDDEEVLVEMGKSMLEWLGYEVRATTSSVEALEFFRTHSDRFDAVITDFTMPNLTGADLAKEIMHIRPDIPVILSTGFSEKITEEKAREMGIRAFTMKPLNMRDIAETIRRVLDKK